MNKRQEDNLVWFLGFTNLDLASLSDDELFRTALDLANKCHWLDEVSLSPPLAEPNLYQSEITEKYDEESLWQRIDEVKSEIQTIQSDLRRFANRLFSEAWGSIADLGLLPRDMHDGPYRLDLGVLRVSVAANIAITHPIRMTLQRNGGGKISRSTPNASDMPFIEVMMVAPTNSLGAQFKFLEALNGVALTKIAKCDGCGGFFLQTSKHRRRFCNQACASKANKKMKRLHLKFFEPEAYERYLEGGRERAAKAYEAKIEREGPPGARVTRRPRKSRGKRKEE